MSGDNQIRTRRALNSLQYETNGKNIVGLSANHKSNQIVNPKQALFEQTNQKLSKLKRRTSISLPDINIMSSFGDSNNLNKSATSTPNKRAQRQLTSSKSNISIIHEEKENPNYVKNKATKMKKIETKISSKLAANKALKDTEIKSKEISVQCNKTEEDMVFGDSVNGTDYWRLIAHKRSRALDDTQKENSTLHKDIEDLNDKNEVIRENIKELLELINEYKEIQKSMLEEEDDNDEADSGFDLA